MSLRPVFFGGTGSDAGKSLMAAACLAAARRKQLRACPFKAQNMSLNSYVPDGGGEMGVAQAVQAQAAGCNPDVRMNPVLLKPCDDGVSEVIVLGKSQGRFRVSEYYRQRERFAAIARKAFDSLRKEFDWVVLEGAGSVAEINLWDRDFVNLSMARYAKARVILVADMERGGAFAALHGTYDLLPRDWKHNIAGYILNKFRGDASLLDPGIRTLEEKDNLACLGVFPYLSGLRLPSEDSLSSSLVNRPGKDLLLGIVMWPHASQMTDLEPLLPYTEVGFRLLDASSGTRGLDAVILPGTKNTVADLSWLRSGTLFKELQEFSGPVFGICGGLQIMGREVSDKFGVEGGVNDTGIGGGVVSGEVAGLDVRVGNTVENGTADGTAGDKPSALEGLGMLTLTTHFEKTKVARRVRFKEPLFSRDVEGFEIHYGQSLPRRDFYFEGKRMGTYAHGILDNDGFRNKFLEYVYHLKTGTQKEYTLSWSPSRQTDQLAGHFEKHVNFPIPIPISIRNSPNAGVAAK